MQRGSPSQGWGSPKVIRTLWGRSDGSARRRQALPEEISVLVRSHRTTAAAMQRDRGGEVSRSHSSHDGRRAESSNAGSRLRVSMTDYGRKQRYSVRNGACHGAVARRNRPAAFVEALLSSRHLTRNESWRLAALHRLKKPPYTSKYVRWCGRTGP